MGMRIDDTVGNGNGKEWESPCMGMRMALIPMVFSLCNSNVQFIMTFIIYHDNSAFDDNSAPLNVNC